MQYVRGQEDYTNVSCWVLQAQDNQSERLFFRTMFDGWKLFSEFAGFSPSLPSDDSEWLRLSDHIDVSSFDQVIINIANVLQYLFPAHF